MTGISEVYMKIALEDTPKVRNGAVMHSGTNLGDICERDARLFAVGAQTVEYSNQVFTKNIDQASFVDGFAVREMWYHPRKV